MKTLGVSDIYLIPKLISLELIYILPKLSFLAHLSTSSFA